MSENLQIIPMNPKVQIACIVIGTVLLLKGIKGVSIVDLRLPPGTA